MPEVTNVPDPTLLPQTISADSSTAQTFGSLAQFETTPSIQHMIATPAGDPVDATLVGIPPAP